MNTSLLNNIESHNINSNNSNYYNKAVKKTIKKLNKKYKSHFKIEVVKASSPNKNINLLKVPIMLDFLTRKVFYSTNVMILYQYTGNDTLEKIFKKKKVPNQTQQIHSAICPHLNDMFKNKKFVSYTLYESLFTHEKDRYHIQVQTRPDNSVMMSLHATDNINHFIGVKPYNIIFYEIVKAHDFSDRDTFFGKIREFLFQKVLNYVPKRLPLSMLFFDIKESKSPECEKSEKYTRIKWGYTYMDSRGFSLSTILRKLLQLYSYSHGSTMITSQAVRWGSQIASKKSGMFVMPEVGHRQFKWARLPPHIRRKLGITEMNDTKLNYVQTKRSKIIEKCKSAMRKYVSNQSQSCCHSSTNKRSHVRPFMSRSQGNFWVSHNQYNPTRRNYNIIKQHYGGKIPINFYGNGAKLNILMKPNSSTNVSTAARKLTPRRMKNLYNSL